MTAGYLPLALQQGEPFSSLVTTLGVDLTGRTTGLAQVRTAAASPDVAVVFAVTITPTGVGSSTVLITSDTAQIVGLPPGGYVWDLFADSPALAAPVRVLCGPVNVTALISRGGSPTETGGSPSQLV